MKKQKKAKSKLIKAESSTASDSLIYTHKVLSAFAHLFEIYIGKNSLDILNYAEYIENINTMHKKDPASNNLPAVCCYVNNVDIQDTQINFLDSLKENGLIVNVNPAANSVLLSKALSTVNLRLLKWLCTQCNIKVVSSRNFMGQRIVKLDNSWLDVLKYIEDNIDNQAKRDVINSLIEIIPLSQLDGSTVLHLAAVFDKAKLFQRLVATGRGDINQPNLKGLTPAMLAAEFANLNTHNQVINLLINTPIGDKLDLTCKTYLDETIFHRIIIGKNIKFFRFAVEKLFVEFNENLTTKQKFFNELTNKSGYNLLHWAISNKQCALFYELFPLIDLNADGPDGNHIIVYAFLNNEPDMGYHIAAFLGINLETYKFKNNKTISQIVVENDIWPVLDWLIAEEIFDISALSSDNLPPLLLAAKCGSINVVNIILRTFSPDLLNFDYQTEDGKKYGHYLVEKNLHAYVQFLLKNNALDLIHQDNNGDTLLDIALKQNHQEIIDLLLDYIEIQFTKKRKFPINLSKTKQLPALLDVYCADKMGRRASKIDGFLPLHLACLELDVEHIGDLIAKHQLNINQKNEHGETALSIILKNTADLEKAIAIIDKFNPKITNLDNNESNLLQLACECNLESLVAWCLTNKQFPITKGRKDKKSALDLTIINHSSAILHLLWSKMSLKEQSEYIRGLKQKKEQILLAYLAEEGLYKPQDSSLNQSITTEEAVNKCKQKNVKKSTTPPTVTKPTTNAKSQAIDNAQVNLKLPASATKEKIQGSLICDRETLLKSVEAGNFLYFKKLKHHPEYNELVKENTEILLLTAINAKNHRLLYHMLRHPAIEAQSHVNNNIALVTACKIGLKSSVIALLAMKNVEESLADSLYLALEAANNHNHLEIVELLESYKTANNLNMEKIAIKSDLLASDAVIISNLKIPVMPQTGTQEREIIGKNSSTRLPWCLLADEKLYDAYKQISQIFIEVGVNGYIYGSTHYKLKPGDFDILLPAYSMEFDCKKIFQLIKNFKDKGGIVSNGERLYEWYGYSYEGRQIIPVHWYGVNLDIVVSSKTISQHAMELDFTNSAKYLSLLTGSYAVTPGIDPDRDIEQKLIKTIIPAKKSFLHDPRRIFKAIKLIVEEGLILSDECRMAIKDIFSDAKNPFLTNTTPNKIYHRLQMMKESRQIYKYFTVFDRLGILSKLEEFLLSRQETQAYNYLKDIKDFNIIKQVSNFDSYVANNRNRIFAHQSTRERDCKQQNDRLTIQL